MGSQRKSGLVSTGDVKAQAQLELDISVGLGVSAGW